MDYNTTLEQVLDLIDGVQELVILTREDRGKTKILFHGTLESSGSYRALRKYTNRIVYKITFERDDGKVAISIQLA